MSERELALSTIKVIEGGGSLFIGGMGHNGPCEMTPEVKALVLDCLKERCGFREAIEAAAKVADQIAINAERRAAGHADAEAKRSALDKMESAQEVRDVIRALSPSPQALSGEE